MVNKCLTFLKREIKKIRIVPKGLPGMKTCTLTLTGQLREDVVLFVIEYPYKDVGEKKVNKEGKATYDEEREAIYGLWLADKKWAAAMAQRFPVLAPIWAKYR